MHYRIFTIALATVTLASCQHLQRSSNIGNKIAPVIGQIVHNATADAESMNIFVPAGNFGQYQEPSQCSSTVTTQIDAVTRKHCALCPGTTTCRTYTRNAIPTPGLVRKQDFQSRHDYEDYSEYLCDTSDRPCSSCYQAIATVSLCGEVYPDFYSWSDLNLAQCLCYDYSDHGAKSTWVGDQFDTPYSACSVYAETIGTLVEDSLSSGLGFCASISPYIEAALFSATLTEEESYTSGFASATSMAGATRTPTPASGVSSATASATASTTTGKTAAEQTTSETASESLETTSTIAQTASTVAPSTASISSGAVACSGLPSQGWLMGVLAAGAYLDLIY